MPRSVFPSRVLPCLVALPLSFAFALFLRGPIALAAPDAPVAAPNAAPFNPAPTPPQTQLVVAQGIVRDPDGKPLKGALVSALNLTREGVALPQTTVQTDAQGHFSVEVSLPLEFLTELRRFLKVDETDFHLVAVVHAPGYAVTQRLLSGAKTKGPNLPANDIKLARGFSATGQVVDKDGKPLPGVMVQADSVRLAGQTPESPESMVWFQGLALDNPLKQNFQAVSDATGHFTLHDLPLGTVNLVLKDPRFIRQETDIKVSDTPIPLDQVPTLTAQVAAKLRGRVLYPDGKPVVGVQVTASNVSKDNRIVSELVLTQPDGTYVFESLAAGKIVVSTGAPSEEWTGTSAPPIELKPGADTKVGDITLAHGILLTGYVREAETKAPVVGATVNAQHNNTDSVDAKTDAQGRYQIRVQPGQYRFYISDTPADYLRWDDNQPQLTIVPDSKMAPEFTLRRGVTLTGTAKDAKGQPATGAIISTQNNGPEATSTVDAQGNWTLHGLDPAQYGGGEKGTIKLRIAGEWTLRGNAIVKLPSPPLSLVLMPIKLQAVKVRVVTPQGQPVADATVRYQFFTTSENDTWEWKTATSDAQGEVALTGLRPEQPLELTATKKGYLLSQKGKVSRFGALDEKTAATGLLRATDIVMAPLDAKITGRVLDAQGQPAQGARVALLFPNDLRDLPDGSVLTDDKGQFTLTGLPQGEVTIGVAKGRAYGQVTLQANGVAELKLGADLPLVAPHNTEAAFVQLEQWTQDERAGNGIANRRQTYNLSPLAVQLTIYDNERAQRAMTDANGKINQEFLAAAPLRLARANPQRAAAWGKTLLPLIEDEDERTNAKLRLAALTAGADTAGAQQIYDAVALGIAPTDFSSDAALRYAELAGLAGALKNPDAEGWLQALIMCVNAMTEDERNENLATIVTALADGDLPTTRKWATQLAPLIQVEVLGDLVSWGVKHDLPAAQQMVSDLDALIKRPDFPAEKPRNDEDYHPSSSDILNSARTEIVTALMATDLHAAQAMLQNFADEIELGENVKFDIQARLAGAQDGDAIRTTLDTARQEWESPAGDMAFIAAIISETLPQVSAQAFKDARDKLGHRNDDSRGGESAALYAYAHSSFDPAESRLLLENEWLRATQALRAANNAGEKGESNSWEMISRMRGIMRAMIPLSTARTDEMIKEALTLNTNMTYYAFGVRHQIVKWLLADAATRRAMPLQNDYDDGDDED